MWIRLSPAAPRSAATTVRVTSRSMVTAADGAARGKLRGRPGCRPRDPRHPAHQPPQAPRGAEGQPSGQGSRLPEAPGQNERKVGTPRSEFDEVGGQPRKALDDDSYHII